MRIDLTGESRATEGIGAWRVERHDDAGGCPRFRPEHKEPCLSRSDLTAGLADELRSTLEEHDCPISAERIGRRHARRHARQGRVDGGLERTVDECAFREQEALGWKHRGLHGWRDARTKERSQGTLTRCRRPGRIRWLRRRPWQCRAAGRDRRRNSRRAVPRCAWPGGFGEHWPLALPLESAGSSLYRG